MDFSAAKLASNCGGFDGFTFQQDDIVELKAFYYVKGNIGGSIIETIDIENEFYLSDTEEGQAFQCRDLDGSFTLIGYYIRNNHSEQYNVENCTKTISQNFKLSVGNCCSNLEGGNLFPYEYRNWGTLYSVRAVIPDGYSFVSANMEQSRTLYTNASVTEYVGDMLPTQQVGNEYTFDISQYYTPNKYCCRARLQH